MDANTQIEKLFSSISSIEESLLSLQDQTAKFGDMVTVKETTDDVVVSTENLSDTQKLEKLKSGISERSAQLENLISTVLHPNVINNKINNLNKMQQRIDYWKDRGLK